MCKVITFATLKGGTGKTMTTFSTAGILAERGKRVAIADIDPQANITSNLGIDETEECFKGIQELFENPKEDISKVIRKSPIPELPTLDIIPGSVLLTATERNINGLAGRENLLKRCFKHNDEVISKYDYIFFDTNPYMTVVNQNAFYISDAIILVTNCGMNSLKGVELFQALWDEIREGLDKEDNIKGLLINLFDQRVKLQKEFVEYCRGRDDFKNILFKTIIPDNSKLTETEVEFKPINLYDKNSKGYRAYVNFVDELITRI